jgi:hypothetical protein
LAGVVETLEEKEECFNKALSLDPDNAEAQAGLRLVEQKLAGQPPDAGHMADEQPAVSPETDTPAHVCYRHPQVAGRFSLSGLYQGTRR